MSAGALQALGARPIRCSSTWSCNGHPLKCNLMTPPKSPSRKFVMAWYSLGQITSNATAFSIADSR
jgi:hypothetical protein